MPVSLYAALQGSTVSIEHERQQCVCSLRHTDCHKCRSFMGTLKAYVKLLAYLCRRKELYVWICYRR